MEDIYESLLFEGELSPEERDAFLRQMEEDPELARAWAGWQQVCGRLRDRLQAHLTDRRLLVLYALEQEGYGAALTAEERQALDASREEIARSLDAIPALEQVVERIQDERADFEEVWRQHMETKDPVTTSSARDVRSDRPPRPSRARDQQREWRWGRRLALAALLVAIGSLAFFFWPQDASRTTVEISDGEQQVVELSDGSTVRLRGAAALSYVPGALEGEPRQVTLEYGRAFFDVVPLEQETSFVVETPTATTTVLGTQFGVATGEDTTAVVLASGRIQVGASDGATDGTVALSPGERSLIRQGRPPTPPAPVDLTSALDWSGLFVFRSLSVEEIARRLSDHYNVTITVASDLQEERVTGTFERDQPVDQVLETLATTLDAEVQREENTYQFLVP